jgi:hypothetical protein
LNDSKSIDAQLAKYFTYVNNKRENNNMTTTHVRAELIKVHCGNTEDTTGEDEFYIVGGLTDGVKYHAALTSPMGINDGQEKNFTPNQRVIFNDMVDSQGVIRGGLKAYDEDFGKDWAKYGSTVEKITDGISMGLKATKNPKAVAAGEVLKWSVKGFGFLASLDKDDELGNIELNIPANGSTYEEITWKFWRKGGTFSTSTWNYSVVIGVTRGTDAASRAITAASLGKRIYAFTRGIKDNRIYINSATDGQAFGGWQEVQGNGTTDTAVAAASLGNRIYVFAKGVNDNRIYVNSAADGQPFGGWQEVQGNGTTDTAVAAASLGNRIYVFAKGVNDNRIYANSAVDGKPFSSWQEVQGKGIKASSLAAASLGKRIYLFARSSDNNRIYVNSAADGQPFGGWQEVQGNATTDAAVAAASLGNRIYVFAKGISDNRIYVNSAADGQPFSGWQEVQGNGTADTAVGAASLGKRIYVFGRGIHDQKTYVNSAADGQPFGNWSLF